MPRWTTQSLRSRDTAPRAGLGVAGVGTGAAEAMAGAGAAAMEVLAAAAAGATAGMVATRSRNLAANLSALDESMTCLNACVEANAC